MFTDPNTKGSHGQAMHVERKQRQEEGPVLVSFHPKEKAILNVGYQKDHIVWNHLFFYFIFICFKKLFIYVHVFFSLLLLCRRSTKPAAKLFCVVLFFISFIILSFCYICIEREDLQFIASYRLMFFPLHLKNWTQQF